jgi:site-specific DNA-cytosine methylase
MANDSMGVVNNYRIRKLTPKECWRLMRFWRWRFWKSTSNTNE